MLQVRYNEISLRQWSGGTAQLRTLEGTLVVKYALCWQQGLFSHRMKVRDLCYQQSLAAYMCQDVCIQQSHASKRCCRNQGRPKPMQLHWALRLWAPRAIVFG